jgi:hypothetical protein
VRLQEAYAFVGVALRRRRVQVIEVDPAQRSSAVVADEIGAALDRAAAVEEARS